jgi:aryl-alcohol dehydrogenase-like predicted oxidoreductase
MRMSTDEQRDEELALETIAAAVGAGITVFDTAHSYGRDASESGHNERLVARALRRCDASASARVVTKGGMARVDGGWIPDGRARAIRADCEASLAALDGLPIDLYLIHAPDPRTPWRTSLRALARLVDEHLVRRVGVANVNRVQLDEALELAPVAAVQVALNPYDDAALRGGLVERCDAAGVTLIAHSPLGGPRRAARLARKPALADTANARKATPAEVALAWLLALSPAVVAIPGARRPETARSAARAATVELDTREREMLMRELGGTRAAHVTRPQRADDADVVLVMGIPGAGKSHVAAEFAARGYVRLNRDERGGSLREIAGALDSELSSGNRRVVLDNTYLSRASRSYVIESASSHHIATRCIWLDTPLAHAQVNIVRRLLDRFGSLPEPDELRRLARSEPGVVLAPTSQMRALRELEPPSPDEGFAEIEHVPFERARRGGVAGVLVAAAAVRSRDWKAALADLPHDAPHLIFDWSPDSGLDSLDDGVARLSAEVTGVVAAALCPHPAGPPSCWCRPPLPGLPLAFARAHGVDLTLSTFVGSGPAHRTLATTFGARYVAV